MATVYILYSESLKKFYTGSCKNISERLEEHREKKIQNAFTSKVSDWTLFFQLNDLSYVQARKIESHIKKMKSSTYIENLLNYPEIADQLCKKYE